jgi:hypothetical protein
VIRCTLPNTLWQIAGAPESRRFERALRNPEEAQRAILHRLVRRNRGTRFGREHGFAEIRSVEDYRARVPLRGYDEIAPWIEAIRRGEADVLTRERVTRLVPTGGSSGGRKLIPWTASLGREFRRALAPWIVDLFLRQPELKGGPAYWSVSPAPGPEVDDGPVPIGFDGDSAYLGGRLAALVRPTLAFPESAARGLDVRGLQHATLVHLLRCRELRLVSVWHPSFFGVLLDRMAEWWDRLMEDVERGGSAGGGLPPDPRRARELRRLGPHALREIWPRLGLVSCWTDAGAAASARELQERFPHVPVQGKGLLATEGVMSIPFGGGRPLAVRSHFLEFLDDDGRPQLAHELAEGRTYAVVLTTSGGLYRYLTHDRVRVVGRTAATPSIRFAGRGDRVSDLRGEKLTDAFVQGVLDRLFEPGERVRFAMLAPTGGDSAGYALFVDASGDVADSWADRLDALLRGNPHYRWAREVGQLAPPEVVRVPAGAQRIYLEAQAARGRRLGDVKPVALDTRTDWRAVFEEAAARGASARGASGREVSARPP